MPTGTLSIAHVTSHFDASESGVSAAVCALASVQHQAGHHVRILATFCEDNASGPRSAAHQAEQMTARGVPVTLIGPCKKPLMGHPDLERTLGRALGGVDVVHVHAVWEEIQHQAAIIAQRLHKPYLICPHGMLETDALAQGWIKKRMYLSLRLSKNLHHASGIHFADELEQSSTLQTLRLACPSLIEPPAPDLSRLQGVPALGAFRGQFPMLRERALALFAGRLHPDNRLDRLLEAFARVQDVQAVLMLAGAAAPDYPDHLMALARALGIAHRLILSGPLQDDARQAAIADADVYVVPARRDDAGLAILQALALGTVVATGMGLGTDPWLDAPEEAADETATLAGRLRHWLGDAALRASAAEKAQERVRRHFQPQAVGQRWAEHYASLTGESSPPDDLGVGELVGG